jgi:large subunit ribosomal protein L21
MYAVIDTGGHQYRVREGELLRVDLRQELAPGTEITLEKVLLAGGPSGVRVGTPHIAGAAVTAVVEANAVKGPKLRGMKRRSTNSSKTRYGHRQKHTLLRIGRIRLPSP